MRFPILAAATLASALSASAANANPVLMISIDGLRPRDITEADQRGLKVPNLRAFLADGSYATGVKNVLPTVTYPDHTTLITGVWPDVHGISNNLKFDPLNKTNHAWYWFAKDIKVPTLWDAVHASHQVVASFSWPVSVGAASIDYNIPEYWQTFTASDIPLIHDQSTPGLPEMLEQATSVKLAQTYGEGPENDEARAKLAAALIDMKHPQFTTIHLLSLDGTQHKFGPDTMEAHAVLESLDATVGELVAAARKSEPDLVVAVVSDHGFAPISEETNLIIPFAKAGFIKLDKDGKVVSWDAFPWNAGGSAAIVLSRPQDKKLVKKVGDFLQALVADPHSGLRQVVDVKEVAALGGGKEASFWVDCKLGMETGDKTTGAPVDAAPINGTHGYFPWHPEMRATFMIEGPNVPKGQSLGDIDMRAIAPTLANILGVSLKDAKQKPLF